MFNKMASIRVSLRTLMLMISLWLMATLAFGWAVYHATAGSNRLGVVGSASLRLAILPDQVRDMVDGNDFAETPDKQPLQKSGFERFVVEAPGSPEAGLLISRYSADVGHYVVDLISERSGQLWRRYDPQTPVMGYSLKAFGLESAFAGSRARFRPTHPLLMEDGGVIFAGSSPLIRVDACGRVKWVINGRFHHSIESGVNGTIWVANGLDKSSRKEFSWHQSESELVQVSPDGAVLTRVPLYSIFVNNDMRQFIDGRAYVDDPYHINDIQPVLVSGPYWQKGDLFISLRNLSMVLQFRPATGKVIWHREGPWLSQHDVNIVDDHRISIFDNHVSQGFGPNVVDGSNRMAIVDFRNGQVSFDYDQGFVGNAIKTVTEGRGEILPDGDVIVEDSNSGRLMRMAPDGTLRWRFIHAKPDGTGMVLGWSRYVDPVRYADAIRKAKEAKCGQAQ
jgi:hypothetical protein